MLLILILLNVNIIFLHLILNNYVNTLHSEITFLLNNVTFSDLQILL